MHEHAGEVRGGLDLDSTGLCGEEALWFCVRGFGGTLEGSKQGAACSDLQGSYADPANECLENAWHVVGA